MDLLEQLVASINTQNLPTLKIGYVSDEESFVVYPLPGSRATKAYMDGTAELVINYEIIHKSKDQELINATLWQVQSYLEMIEDLPSTEYTFIGLEVTNKPYIQSLDVQGWYQSCIDIAITIEIKENQ